MRGGEGKWLLKKAMEPHLPHEVLYRPKMGFAVPLARWFRGPLRERVRDALLGRALAAPASSTARYLEHLVDAHQSGARDYSAPLWTLLMFEAFLRNVAVELAAHGASRGLMAARRSAPSADVSAARSIRSACAASTASSSSTAHSAPAEWLARMGDVTVHRGPDDDGVHVDGPCAIGMRRLSIIDLAGGHQPLVERGRHAVAGLQRRDLQLPRAARASSQAQGHRFRTGSDCESILHALRASTATTSSSA